MIMASFGLNVEFRFITEESKILQEFHNRSNGKSCQSWRDSDH